MINTTNEILYRLDNLNSEQRRISYQISTGRKLDNGSDDAVVYGQQIDIENRLKVYDGIKSQIQTADTQSNIADSALSEIKQLLEYSKAELIKSRNATTDVEGRMAIASNLIGVKANLLDFANEKLDGQYLFAGSDSRIRPFEDDGNGNISYNGDNQLKKVIVEDGVYRNISTNGFDIMMYNIDEATKNEPELTFTADQRIVDQDRYEWKLDESQTNLVRYDKNGNATSDTKNVTSNGTNFIVNIGTDNGQKFEAKTSIFNLLDNAINALKGVDNLENPIDDEQSFTT